MVAAFLLAGFFTVLADLLLAALDAGFLAATFFVVFAVLVAAAIEDGFFLIEVDMMPGMASAEPFTFDFGVALVAVVLIALVM